MYTSHVFSVAGGFGFEILHHGEVVLRQEYKMEDGFQTMTIAEAEAAAQALISAYNTPPPEDPEPEPPPDLSSRLTALEDALGALLGGADGE